MRVVDFVKRTPCAVLLVVQLGCVLLYPFMEGTAAGRAAFGILVLALAVIAIRATPFLSWVGVRIAAPAMVLLGIQIFAASHELFPWSSAFEAVLYFYAAMSMLAYLLQDTHVSTDELFAIGAVFTLLAWAFAFVFVVVQASAPGVSRPRARVPALGWSFFSCLSRCCPARALRTSRRSAAMPGAWS